MGLSLNLERGHEGRTREVPWEDRCSSRLYTLSLHRLVFTCHTRIPVSGKPIHDIDVVNFLKVKNKPWHKWVYTWFWHHRKHKKILNFTISFGILKKICLNPRSSLQLHENKKEKKICLASQSGAHIEYVHGKNRGKKSRATVPFRNSANLGSFFKETVSKLSFNYLRQYNIQKFKNYKRLYRQPWFNL